MLRILKEQFEGKQRGGALYSVSEERVYNNFQLQIPITNHYETKSYYCGAGHGWLARVVLNPLDEFSKLPKPPKLRITLLNPFKSKGASISLPHFPLGEYYFGQPTDARQYNMKVVLSADPILNPDNYMVIVFCGTLISTRACFHQRRTKVLDLG